ncbi:acyltransferase family protein [Parasphingorhabdus sp.]|uniref:acyltransferase family protein n=1 Tax=Parasphingorhabdus sp. TaxID=2709688 RepID=UPI003A8F22D7
MTSAKYRPDVDGLRAVAVAMVLVNHTNENWLPSGFVGVDIFFVISGFVVTSSMLSGHHGTGWTGLAEFWRRRMLRILPALSVFVLLTGLMFAGFFALTTHVQFISAIRTGLTALFGVSNLYLTSISSDYFLLDQSINPFLHTWSLGVEEQFYVFFAILFFLVSAFLDRRKALIWIIAALCLLSLGAFIWGMTAAPIATYYGLHARFWELGIGALIAFLAVGRDRKGTRSPAVEVAAFLGAVLIFLSAFLEIEGANTAKFAIIGAVAGAAIFIASGVFRANLTGRLLSYRPVVFIGLLSYSIYLYHWPVLVFIKWNNADSAISYIVGLFLVLMLSYLSYRFVEGPLRRYRGPFLTRVLPIGVATVSAVALTMFLLGSTQGALYAGKPAKPDDWLLPMSVPYAKSGSIKADDCLLTNGSDVLGNVPQTCFTQTGDNWNGSTVLLIGDSHAYADFAMIAGLESYKQFRGGALVHDGCAIHTKQRVDSSCHKYQTSAADLVRKTVSAGDYVMVSAHFPIDQGFDEDRVYRFLKTIDDAARDVGASLIVELPHIRSEKNAVSCQIEWFRTDYVGCSKSLSDMNAARSKAVAAIRNIGSKLNPNTLFWDPLPYLCENSRCDAVTASGPVLRDHNHLAVRASASLTPPFVDFLEQSKSRSRH